MAVGVAFEWCTRQERQDQEDPALESHSPYLHIPYLLYVTWIPSIYKVSTWTINFEFERALSLSESDSDARRTALYGAD